MEELIQRLKSNFKYLSKGQKKVAKLLFDDPSIITFSPAFEIGRMVNVSESTVIRLSQTIGYTGYTELQETIRQSLSQGRVLMQYQEISNIVKEDALFKDLMQADINNIKKLMDKITEEDIQVAVTMISNAEKIYVTGSMSMLGLAHYFSQWLNMLLGNTELLISESPQYFTQLSKVDNNTLLIPMIFPRYVKSTVKTTEMAKKKGANVLAITDSELSPIKGFSDRILTVAINSEIEIDSYTAPLSLLNTLMRYVSIKESERIRKNLKSIEEIYKEHETFYTS